MILYTCGTVSSKIKRFECIRCNHTQLCTIVSLFFKVQCEEMAINCSKFRKLYLGVVVLCIIDQQVHAMHRA